MAKTTFRGGSIQEENETMDNPEPITNKFPMDISHSPFLSKKQADILARFQIGSSTPDLPLYGTSNGNGADQNNPFMFEQRLAKAGTEASLATYASSLYNGIQIRTDGSKFSEDACKSGDKKENLAAILRCANELKLENRPIPKISPTQVLLEMETCGICGTDVEVYLQGKLGPWILKEPIIVGHEGSGTVLECGANVKDLKPGDKVAIEPHIPCRTCRLCKGGKYHMCPNIIHCGSPPHNGNLSRFFVHEHDFCYKVPCAFDYDVAMLLEPLSLAVHVCKRGHISFGDSVLILGSGTVGLLTMLAARAYGASSVVVLDIDSYKLKKAMDMGADFSINCKGVREEEIVKKVHEFLGGQPPNKAVDCAGFEAAKRIGILATGLCGTVVIVGMGKHDQSLPIMDAIFREIEVVGSLGYCNDFGIAMDMVVNGKVDPRPVITHHFKLEDACKAYDFAAKKQEHIKVVIHPNPKWKPATDDKC